MTVKTKQPAHRFRDKVLQHELENRGADASRPLLIVDGWTFSPPTALRPACFFALSAIATKHGTTLITTNKAVKEWPEILASNSAMATALLGRLLHKCHVFNIKGRSYRTQGLERLLT